MRLLRLWLARIKGTLNRRREDAQMDEEFAAHLDLLRNRYLARGLSPEDADRAARLQFGSPTVLKERQRALRGFLAPSEAWRDLRFASRMLRRNWLSNLAIVVALALGIGMNAAVFTFVNALLLRPPAGVSTSGNLMEVWLHSRDAAGLQSYVPFNYPDYFFYRAHTHSFDGILAFDGDPLEAIWNREGSGQTVREQLVSGNFFSVLGIRTVLGSAFTPTDDQLDNPHPVIVLSHTFWKTQFGADPHVIGRTLLLNGTAFTVIGVAPPNFAGLLIGIEPDFWAPLSTQEIFTRDKTRATDRNGFWLIVSGRLKAGVSQKQAQAELTLIGRQIEQLHPDALNHMDPVVYPMTLVPGPYRGYVLAFTGSLLLVFLLVLLIACTNAASLLLARATARTREMAIRTALGAGRSRLIRQLLVESLLLASLAGVAAVGIGGAVAHLLLRLKPATIPVTLQLPLDWRVLSWTLLVSVAAGLAFGLVPALRTSAIRPGAALREEAPGGGLRRSRLRIALLIGQIAVSVVLLTGATLCVRSLLHANAIDPGFDTQHIALATLNPAALGKSPAQVDAFYTQLLDRTRRIPGVTSASDTDFLPLGTSGSFTPAARHQGAPEIGSFVFRVDPGYFAAMGIPLLAGHDFTPGEVRCGAPGSVVVNAYLARKLWPGEDPIGQTLTLGGEKGTATVIGVVRNGKYRTLGESPSSAVYLGCLPPQRTLIVRTAGDDRPLLAELRREVPEVDPLMVATHVQTIEDAMALPLFPARTTGLLLGASGLLALVLTAIGLFGVIAYVVSQRTHEIGIRIALGARRSHVLRLVLRQGLSVTAIGLAIGIGAALAACRLLAPLLYGISATDPLTLAGVACGLALVTILACYLPARRAMHIDPAEALRCE